MATWLFAGCGGKTERPASESPALPTAKVRVQAIESGPQPVFEEVIGTVRSKIRATLEAKFSGRIVALPVALGQRVKAGELVARLDAAEVVARLDQANASLEQAERDWKRVSALFAQQSATRSEYDSADARVRVAKGAAAEAKAMLSYVEVLAPFNGVVTRKWADVGDLAAPGKPLLAVEDPSALQLEADVPEAVASHIQRNARLTARVDGVGKELIAEIVEIAPVADPVSRTFRIKLELPSQPGLMPGQFARLSVPMGESDSLRVPASAVVRRGQLEIVFANVKERAELRLVKTGKHLGETVEILSGLDRGDSVVIEGAPQLTDGQPLEAK